ncbi:hypothetical protein [Candidatus Nitrotoga sp. M5]|uniref:hypothetical protein n=1 Tax=Candidatus Nitrotoga sp. M5 TaxID=2890409 RepID=UPI001EF3DBB0|nr:hypothetical protein [Candidatus Nitrotoga sp. M5]CAH1387039.1 conserved hypothetical protein [Candidatus Nitrotoga sp. M5]
MSTHKKGISQNAIGRAIGLSSAGMVKLKKQGCPMDSVESVMAWRKNNQNIAARKPEIVAPVKPQEVESGAETFDKARTRREVADANKSEMEVAELCGLLIRVDAVKIALASSFSTTREALLQIPSRLSSLLAAEGDPAKVQNLLHAEIHNALHQLSGSIDQVGNVDRASND